MKVYKCDSCGKVIENPFKIKMKEFFVGVDFDLTGIFPKKTKLTKRVHICDECYKGLYIIAKRQCLQMVNTKDFLIRNKQKYEVVIADDNIFVICPIIYDEVEQSDIVKYDKAEIYANQSSINTLDELGFIKWK